MEYGTVKMKQIQSINSSTTNNQQLSKIMEHSTSNKKQERKSINQQLNYK